MAAFEKEMNKAVKRLNQGDKGNPYENPGIKDSEDCGIIISMETLAKPDPPPCNLDFTQESLLCHDKKKRLE